MKVRRAGDGMLLVELASSMDLKANLQAVALGERVLAAAIVGVRDIVPGYGSLGVHFDPLRTDLAALEQAIVAAWPAATMVAAAVEERAPARVHDIPVRYGGADGPDLDQVAAMAGLSPSDVVDRHAAVTYRVYMLGFVPGFAYLGRVDASIAAPRRNVPRDRVAPGSVGIAGEQTGVYPAATPGGWQLIGRTTAVMFDSARHPASLLAPGDAVRFVPQ